MAYMRFLILAPVYVESSTTEWMENTNNSVFKLQEFSDLGSAHEITIEAPKNVEEDQIVSHATTRSNTFSQGTRGHTFSHSTRSQTAKRGTIRIQAAGHGTTRSQTANKIVRTETFSQTSRSQTINQVTRSQTINQATSCQTINQATKTEIFDPLSLLPQHVDRNYLNFPFLTDKNTFTYINNKNSKVMFIMRGLSGSGKSCIAKIIKSSFEHVLVCSADDFFYTEDGSFKFDHDSLKDAHESCQQKAKQACRRHIPVIVIDNTNVKRWEMKFYVDLANVSNYIIVVVQPKTPWRMNAEELAAKNKHGVTTEILQLKIAKFDDVVPAYYGWFLNEKQSRCLTKLCLDVFLECVSKFSKLKQDLLNELKIELEDVDEETAIRILSSYYPSENMKSSLLHCTAKYCAWGKAPGAKDYHKRSNVQQACGQMFLLTITGLVITKKTIGARVTLESSASVYFDRPEEKDWSSLRLELYPGSEWMGQVDKAFDDDKHVVKRRNRKVKKNPLKLSKKQKKRQKSVPEKHEKVCAEPVIEEHERLHERAANPGDAGSPLNSDMQEAGDSILFLSDMFPALNFSNETRSAHFTVKTARSVASRDVNFEILHACDIETHSVYTNSSFMRVSLGQACYYGDGLCCVYFDKPLAIRTLFSGFY